MSSIILRSPPPPSKCKGIKLCVCFCVTVYFQLDRPGYEAWAKYPGGRLATTGHLPTLPERHQAASAGRPAATTHRQVFFRHTHPDTINNIALLSLTPPPPLLLAQLFFEDALYLSIVSSLVLNPFSFNYFIFCLVYVHILLSVSAATPALPWELFKFYLISSHLVRIDSQTISSHSETIAHISTLFSNSFQRFCLLNFFFLPLEVLAGQASDRWLPEQDTSGLLWPRVADTGADPQRYSGSWESPPTGSCLLCCCRINTPTSAVLLYKHQSHVE